MLDGGAHWRHLANTTEPYMGGGHATLCQIISTTFIIITVLGHIIALFLCLCQFLGRWYVIATLSTSATEINSGVAVLTSDTDDVINVLFTGSTYSCSLLTYLFTPVQITETSLHTVYKDTQGEVTSQ